jgi:hypothetical protein
MKKIKQKIFIVLTIILVSSNIIKAQLVNPCRTVDVIEQEESLHPGYKARVNAMFEQSKRIVEEMKSSRAVNSDTLYRIPVVVHIVHTAPNENLPDSLVFSQIEVLNNDYNRWNSDSTQTRAVFKPIAGSLNFQFYLATTDPTGNPTTGIIRKTGTPAIPFVGFNAFQDNVKNPDEGDAPWNTDKYLNIWVCNLNTIPLGVLGYAYPPTGAANWDAASYTDSAKQGVVIDYTAFGRNNPYVIDPGVAPGRTCVHEVGHYLGLRHIWADEDLCAEDDGIDDTPKAGAASNFDCDTTKNTCVDVGVDYPDMIENFMDYSDEHCQNMFTQEQAAIMLVNLITLRPDLAEKAPLYGVGFSQNNFENNISVYPNPAVDFINIDFKSIRNNQVKIELIDNAGKSVLNKILDVNNYIHAIDISQLTSGFYYLQISNGRYILRKKVVK